MKARRRVGVLVPSANSTVEPDFVLAAPKGITIHANRIGWEAANLAEDEAIVDRMNACVEEAARNLAAARVEVIAYGFATGSFYRGLDYAVRLLGRLEAAVGVPAVAASPAMLDALRTFGARTLSVTSPYAEWNNQRLRAYLEAGGFQALNVAGEPRAAAGGYPTMSDQQPDDVVEFCTRVCDPRADALLISGTMWRALEAAGELERRLGIPVVTANQATIWATLRALGVNQPISGFGSLLEKLG
jgi:maleate isomerase